MNQKELKAIHRRHLWEDIKNIISYYETYIWIVAGVIALVGLTFLGNYLLDKFFKICFAG